MPSAKVRAALKEGPLWPDITNPIAREIVEAAFDSKQSSYVEEIAPGHTSPHFPQYDRYRVEPPGEARSAEIRERLLKSGLAQQIAHGRDALPDIVPGLPWYIRLTLARFKPRNFRELTCHVVQYLDWYLDPQKPPTATHHVRSLKWNYLYQSGWMLFCVLVASQPLMIPWLRIFYTFFAVQTAARLLHSLYFRNPNQPTVLFAKQLAYANEFYYYIRKALADSNPLRSTE